MIFLSNILTCIGQKLSNIFIIYYYFLLRKVQWSSTMQLSYNRVLSKQIKGFLRPQLWWNVQQFVTAGVNIRKIFRDILKFFFAIEKLMTAKKNYEKHCQIFMMKLTTIGSTQLQGKIKNYFNAVLIRLVAQVKISLLLKIQWRKYYNLYKSFARVTRGRGSAKGK